MKKILVCIVFIQVWSCVQACELDQKALQHDTLRWQSKTVDQHCWQEAVTKITAKPDLWTIDLSNHHLGDQKVAQWLQSLRPNAIQSLNLAGNDLRGENSLWQSLKSLSAVTTLHLGYNPMGHGLCKQGFEVLAQGNYKRVSLANIGSYRCHHRKLESLAKSLEWLDLSSHGNQAFDLETWLVSLQKNSVLKTLILNHHNLSQEEFTLLLHLLQRIESLKELSLGDVNLSNSQWQILLPVVAKLPRLKKLSLFNNQLSDASIASLIRGLQPKASLSWLDLSQNSMGQQSLLVLSKWVVTSNLQHLSLRLNPLGGVVSTSLQQFLSQASTLRALDLSHTHITSWQPILLALNKIKQLESLSLASNPELSDATQALAQLLMNHHHLKQIDLSQNTWLDRNSEILSHGFKHNRSLKHIYLLDSRLQDKSALDFARALDDHPQLQSLSLDYNDISVQSFRELEAQLIDDSPLSSLRFQYFN